MELGRRYEFGEWTQPDPQLALRWYRGAAQEGDPDGQCCLGWLLEHGKFVDRDPEAAAAWYTAAAEQGYPRGQYQLAHCLQYGIGLEADPEEALHDACDKFSARFRKTEELASLHGQKMDELSERELVALWKEAKKQLH